MIVMNIKMLSDALHQVKTYGIHNIEIMSYQEGYAIAALLLLSHVCACG